MAESIKISLDTGKYAIPTQEDIDAAKRFVLLREEYAQLLQERIDEVLADATERIIIICYGYDFDPKLLYLGSGFNEQMMNEISEVMDEAEDEIMGLIEDYSTRATSNGNRKSILLAWLLLLGRNKRNLRQTLHTYLYKFMKDIEAAVVALKYSNVQLAQAITKAKTYIHSIYTMPEVQRAFKRAESFAATYIRSRGVVKGNVGLSNNGSTNVTNMAKITLQMAWMRSQVMDYEEQGVVGIYVLRGSSWPCAPCDDNCGFHPIKDAFGVLPVHPSCCCFAVPIYAKEQKME